MNCCLVAKLCPTVCDLMNCNTPGLPILHCLPEFAQTQVHWVGDAIQPSYPLSPPSPPALNLSQHQGLFQWISSLHQVTKVSELELQQQSFQWIFSSLVSSPCSPTTLKSLLQHNSKASILQHSALFMVQFSYLYKTTRKIIALTICTFVYMHHYMQSDISVF